MKLIAYKKCSTCRAVEKMLEEKHIPYEYRDIKEDNPSEAEIKKWHEQSKLDIKKFFNTSGMIYREENLKDKLPTMTTEEKYKLLAKDGMLVKRPILITDDKIYVGPEVKRAIEAM